MRLWRVSPRHERRATRLNRRGLRPPFSLGSAPRARNWVRFPQCPQLGTRVGPTRAELGFVSPGRHFGKSVGPTRAELGRCDSSGSDHAEGCRQADAGDAVGHDDALPARVAEREGDSQEGEGARPRKPQRITFEHLGDSGGEQLPGCQRSASRRRRRAARWSGAEFTLSMWRPSPRVARPDRRIRRRLPLVRSGRRRAPK